MKMKWSKFSGAWELCIAEEESADDGVTMARIDREGRGKYSIEYWADTDTDTESQALEFKGSLPKAKALAFTLVRIS